MPVAAPMITGDPEVVDEVQSDAVKEIQYLWMYVINGTKWSEGVVRLVPAAVEEDDNSL
jgi:hypothetical protein